MKTTTLLDRSLLAAGGPAERGSSCREGQRAQGMMLSDIDAFESQRITDVIYARGQRAQGMMLSDIDDFESQRITDVIYARG
jgi:hypothetical protein